MISCGADSADSTPSLPAQRPFYDFQYNLDQLTVGIRLFHPDYPYSPRIDIYEGATLCDSHPLTSQTRNLTLQNSSKCRDFTINLQYVPAANACQPGGLYLKSGSVTNPADGQTTSYTAMTLAAWDQNYNRVVPWLTPFDTPNLVSQMSQSDYVHADPLSTVGQWTYQLDYASSAIPPDGCSLQTNLDVSISPADETLGARVHNYTIRETNVGGQISCRLDSIITNYNATNGVPDSAARYILDVTLYSRTGGTYYPVIDMPKVVIPVSETN